MQEQRPHEIRRFADGETIPDGYMPITEAEFAKLEPMSVDERAIWFAENGKCDPAAVFEETFTKGDPDEVERRDVLREALDRERERRLAGRRQRDVVGQQFVPRRQHRRQDR